MTSPSRTGIPYPCLTLLLVPAIVPGSSLNSTFGRPTICGPATSGGWVEDHHNSVFRSLVNDVLCVMLNKFASVSIDDILIVSETREGPWTAWYSSTFLKLDFLSKWVNVIFTCRLSPSWGLWCSRYSSRQVPPR